jgi:acetyl esterase/lipase
VDDSDVRVKVEEGVVFGTGAGRDLRCDVYSPVGATTVSPGVLLLHGGGWRRGNRAIMRGYGVRIAREGFVCVASEYRLIGESPWPAAIHDVKAALRWMRVNALNLGIDPQRVAVQGNSAGAHLALIAAATPGKPEFEGEGGHAGASTAVDAVVAIYPPTVFHFDGPRPSGAVPALALLGEAGSAEIARQASPQTYVTPAFPPTFLIHGSADRVVPPSSSQRMYELLSAARVPVDFHMFAGLPHGFANVPEHQRMLAREIVGFLSRHLQRSAESLSRTDAVANP